MKKNTILTFLVAFIIGFSSSAQTAKSKKSTYNANDYALFGEKFEIANVLNNKQMLKKYKALKKGEKIKVNFITTIDAVCQKKGCWMKLVLPDGEEAFVKFKDYEFFVPLNAGGSEVVVSGEASVDIESVDDLKHYAKDAGKSQAEINKITKPEVTYSFMASGVYIKKV